MAASCKLPPSRAGSSVKWLALGALLVTFPPTTVNLAGSGLGFALGAIAGALHVSARREVLAELGRDASFAEAYQRLPMRRAIDGVCLAFSVVTVWLLVRTFVFHGASVWGDALISGSASFSFAAALVNRLHEAHGAPHGAAVDAPRA